MRRFALIILVMLLCLGLQVKARNRALIIGIGHYPDDSGWHELSSVNDVELLKSVLEPAFSLQTLIDSEATKEGIREAFAKLTSATSKEDTLVIHFSGHGQQMITKDVSEPDGLDEAIVPYDALPNETDTYKGENHIRDNELGDWIKELAQKAGEEGAIYVFLDACHSDDANKGANEQNMVYRGTPDIFGAPPNFIPASQYKTDSNLIKREPGSAEVLFLSACQTYQRNREYNGYGSLSYVLANILRRQSLEMSPQFLDSVCSEFSRLKLYQIPGVRATFEYKVPIFVPTEPPTANKDTVNPISWIGIVVGVLLLVVVVILWRKKKIRPNLQDGF